MTLDGGNLRIREALEQPRKPAALQNHVLIDLADDWMGRFTDPGVDCGCRAVAASVQKPHHAVVLQLRQQPQRSVGAAVIDRDDLKRPPITLNGDARNRPSERPCPVQNRHHESDAFRWHAHARILAGKGRSWMMSEYRLSS